MTPETGIRPKFAEFRFYEELNDFLPAEVRRKAFPVAIDRARSVKDAIESVGVPHTEVDLILVDGASVDFGHVLRGGERVAVYPMFERLDVAPLMHLRPRPLREPRFVADTHLGKLARHLRLAGFDCLWEKDFLDEEITALSVAQKRIVLTRDLGILKRSVIERGYFVRATESGAQLREVILAFQLENRLRPFTRCRACNVELRDVAKESVIEHLPQEVRLRFDRFTECPRCRRLFWQGTHYERLLRLLKRVAE